MTKPLTDAALRRLKRGGARHATSDPSVLALLTDVVNNYPQAKIHWLMDSRDAIFNDWYATRLLSTDRLAGMIDTASSVAALGRMAGNDLQQYAVEQRRGELPTRLFTRLDQLLRADPDRFTVMVAASDRGSTCWTLASRPATAVFSDRDHELKSLVFAVGLQTLDEAPEAKKQSQFIVAAELERYAFEMLDRSARGLTLRQLVRGLVIAYSLAPTHEELPDENALGAGSRVSAGADVVAIAAPGLPAADRLQAATRLIAVLTDRQVEVLKKFLEGFTTQREIADAIGCSPGTVSSDVDALRAAISATGPLEDQREILAATATLLYGDEHEL